jgi:hypothetical protein
MAQKVHGTSGPARRREAFVRRRKEGSTRGTQTCARDANAATPTQI